MCEGGEKNLHVQCTRGKINQNVGLLLNGFAGIMPKRSPSTASLYLVFIDKVFFQASQLSASSCRVWGKRTACSGEGGVRCQVSGACVQVPGIKLHALEWAGRAGWCHWEAPLITLKGHGQTSENLRGFPNNWESEFPVILRERQGGRWRRERLLSQILVL